MSTTDTPVLKLAISVEAVRHAPQAFSIVADARECAALKETYELLAVESLSAQGTVTRVGRLFEVRGTVDAEVSQACVVTLEPVEETVHEELEIDLLEVGATPPEVHGEDDPPELLEGGEIDVGALVEEYFVLGLDPYPRRPGAELPQAYGEEQDRRDSPFAALSSLSEGDSGKDKRPKSKD